MAAATIVEKFEGTPFVSSNFYGSWWFTLLWALLTATGIFYFVKRRVRRASTIVLHAAFVIILLGALITHLTAYQGVIHLRKDMPSQVCTDGQTLPFTLTLQEFSIRYHDGTRAEADYESVFLFDDKRQGTVSMNNICSYRGYRFYQSGYDPDGQGSYLAVNSDPWGIPVTYLGYGLLFLSLIWMLIDPKGTYRQLLRHYLQGRTAMVILFCCLVANSHATNSLHTLPRETADRFGRLSVVYNERVCPLQTYAIDFTKKLYGKSYYGDYTAEQVLTGYIFWGDEWSKDLMSRLEGEDLSKTNEKLQLITLLRHGTPLRIFPHTQREHTTWYAPTDPIPETVDTLDQQYIQLIFNVLYEDALKGDYAQMDELLDKMKKYQQKNGGTSLQSATAEKAERLYNVCQAWLSFLFMLCLGMGFVSMLKGRLFQLAARLLLVVSWLFLTVLLVLRWIIVGHIPMSNGYETMLLLAWLIQLIVILSLLIETRQGVHFQGRPCGAATFSLLLSGFFLLVSHLSMMNPQMTHLMPVLQSPLLCLHVSMIMMAYALLSITFLYGITALLNKKKAQQLQLLSLLMLYPALTCLGIGIFLGAIWANISWGTYWSWDPKEVWALITFMVYAIPLHHRKSPWGYHLFMTLAFLTILMTYFGVNYFLGGMHSYA